MNQQAFLRQKFNFIDLGQKAIPIPSATSFQEVGLRKDIITAINKQFQISSPSDIQKLAMPAILQRKDVLCAAETGSGKTLAYLLPVVQMLKKREEEENIKLENRDSKCPKAILLIPSRELGVQSIDIAKSLCHNIKFRAVLLRQEYSQNVRNLSKPVDFLVGTPNKVLEYAKERLLSLKELRFLIIDEADTLLSKDFGEETLELIKLIRKNNVAQNDATQFIFATATIPKYVDRTLDELFPHLRKLRTPSLHRPVPTLKQHFIPVRAFSGTKHDDLLNVLTRNNDIQKTMIFCNTVESCEKLRSYLIEKQIDCIILHSNLPEKERKQAYEKFKEDPSSRLLVCTDIASRGIDTLMVDHVVMCDFPSNAIDYLHRIGRTGRAGRSGRVTCLIARREKLLAATIQSFIRIGKPFGPQPV